MLREKSKEEHKFTSTGIKFWRHQEQMFNYKNGDLISLKRITKSFLEKGNPIFVNGYMYAFDKNYKLYQINCLIKNLMFKLF